MLTALVALSAAASLLACVLVLGMRGKLGGGGNAGFEEALRSLKDKVNDSDKSMRDEFARSRKESADSAKDNREELRTTLAAFEKRLTRMPNPNKTSCANNLRTCSSTAAHPGQAIAGRGEGRSGDGGEATHRDPGRQRQTP